MNNLARDPSDWLSPIIVKELRQGMRGRVFLSSFLLIQVAMIICASGGLVAASLTDVGQFRFFSILFWVIIGMALLIVIPATGNNALRSELQANSLELVYLTRLTPWRIVAGKWAALFAQSLLFVFSVLPYLVLRYFLGGIDLLNELAILLTLLILCALFTALAVAFSGHSTHLVRGGQGLFFMFLFFFGANLLFSPISSSFFFFSGGFGGIESNPFVLTAVFLPLALLLLFEIGAGKIAPAADARSFQLRTLGLLFLVAGIGLETIGSGSGIALSFAFPALVLVGVLSVCESPRWIRSIYTPYTKRGRIGKIAGRLFYPGWPSGIAYVTVVMAVVSGFFLKEQGFADENMNLFLLITYAAFLFPVAITRLIQPSTAHGFNWFLGVHIAMFAIALLLYSAAEANLIAIHPLVGILPTTLALLIAWDELPLNGYAHSYMAFMAFTIVVSWCILAFRAKRLFPHLRKMEEPAAVSAKSVQQA